MGGISQRWFVRLAGGFLGLNAVVGVAAMLAVSVSWHAAIAATVALALALLAASFGWRAASLAWAALLALPGGVVCSMELADYASLARGEIARVGSPRDVVRRATASAFVFERAAVRSALRASYRHASRSRANQSPTVTWFHAAPLVPEGWTPGDRVPAWAVCRDDESGRACRESWDRPLGAAVRPPERYAEQHHAVKAEAESRHGLRSVPDAPALVWVASPGEAIAAQLGSFRLAVTFWNGLFVAGWVGFAGWRLFRRLSPAAERTDP